MKTQFRSNKYTNLYYMIVDYRQNNIPKGYKEKHHIIPRCLKGDNKKTNLVYLNAREHFICHRLLTKMVKQDSPEYYKLWHAFAMMCFCKNEQTQDRQYKVTSKLYEESKKHMSNEMKKMTDKKCNSFGTQWVYNIKLKENKKIGKDDNIPEGWYKGRIINGAEWLPPKPKKELRIIKCKQCDIKFKQKNQKSTFCNDKCKQKYFYKNAKIHKMQKGNIILEIKAQNVPAYRKCGYEII